MEEVPLHLPVAEEGHARLELEAGGGGQGGGGQNGCEPGRATNHGQECAEEQACADRHGKRQPVPHRVQPDGELGDPGRRPGGQQGPRTQRGGVEAGSRNPTGGMSRGGFRGVGPEEKEGQEGHKDESDNPAPEDGRAQAEGSNRRRLERARPDEQEHLGGILGHGARQRGETAGWILGQKREETRLVRREAPDGDAPEQVRGQQQGVGDHQPEPMPAAGPWRDRRRHG